MCLTMGSLCYSRTNYSKLWFLYYLSCLDNVAFKPVLLNLPNVLSCSTFKNIYFFPRFRVYSSRSHYRILSRVPRAMQWVLLSVLYFVVCICGEGDGTPLQYSCLENPMDGGAWWAAVHGVAKSRTRLSNFTFTFHFHALEKEMAAHSSVLAWRIPGTGEPGGLPSMGSHRVRHDWSDLAAAAAAVCICQSQTPNLSPQPPFPFGVPKFVFLCLSVCFCFVN